ncbi:zinc finger and SCAN domain-containing protein 12-like isoform X9 [Spodoptera litura]|uniref:Zinc finger and SCAN domain-containing protein 12-like isoform X9 n=1 Tax=Spodoptera litura TaxID=69820 RepID=A0A9J7E077_SPOLT|nr:zinc finger and SCAN domain-containing protein 12-like isoform X9 [Spodoptera litura]
MDPKTTDWRAGPNVCRCCLAEGCYKDISTEYFWMGKREVYAEMLSETLNLSIAYSNSGGPNSNSRLICELCISRLRDASDFKRQVQECERTFLRHLDPGSSSMVGEVEVTVEPTEIDPDVKLEHVKQEKAVSDDDDDFDERCGFDEDDDDDLDDQPLTRLASRIPKKESVDLLDLLDNTKATEKRKSSSKTKTVPAKKAKTIKKDVKATSSKAPVKTEKKKKGTEVKPRHGALTSIWELTLSERQNASTLLENTTATPFVYCRYYFKCFYCREQYSEINTLLAHTLTHTVPENSVILKEYLPKGKRTVKVDISKLKCRICDISFKDLDEIRKHLKTDHSKSFTESGNGLVAYDLTSKNGQFACHICAKIFQTFILLNRHMNVHFSNAVCETCGAGFMTHQRLIQHKEIHLPGGYPCNKCNKVYTTNSNLKYHIEKAHEGTTKMRMLRCPHCPERFAEHFRKLKHLKEVHGITFTFNCDVCQSVFPSRRALTMHTNKFHTEKTQCDVCKKSFSCVTTLKKHMISHTGERNYVCNLCQKAYRHQKSLKQHMRSHVQGEQFVKFNCSDCGNGFPNRNDFNRHVKEWHPRTYFDYSVH